MYQRTLIPFHSMLAFTFLAGFALPAAAVTDARVSEAYGKMPLQFEANRGQTHNDVRFLSRGPGYSLYLTAGEAVLVLTKPNLDTPRNVRDTRERRDPKLQGNSVAVRMSLVGAARKPQVAGLDELPGKANYFIGKDSAKWRTNVPTYAKVQYQNVYPGIDIVYYGNQRQLEYDLIVAPGADPKKIVLGFKGSDKLEIDAQGDLVLHAAGGHIRQHKPLVYQEIDGVRQEIAGGYIREGANRVGFQLAAYDTARPLVIDPVLAYSTYLGSSGDEQGAAIAVDSDGSAYLTGTTNGANFPVTAGTFDTSVNGLSGVFVTKLDVTGSALIYSTFLGGSGIDQGLGIAVDGSGAAYVTGSALSADFPTTAGAFDTTYNGSGDAFVTKLDPSGSALGYSTFLGGSGSADGGLGIAVDASGSAYVTGFTLSADFPTTSGAFDTSHNGDRDAFVAKLNAAGSALVYSTFLGGTGFEEGRGIAVDALGAAYVTGAVTSRDFPTTPGAFATRFTGFQHVFVSKLDATGSSLAYSTFLGGTSVDEGKSIAVDVTGAAYVTGKTDTKDFPTTVGAFDTTSGCCGFVTKLNSTGSVLVFSTFLKGATGFGIAVDTVGSAYITGDSFGGFPTTPGAFQPSAAGGDDAFVAKLDADGSGLIYSSYLGGSGGDRGSGIAVDASCNAYVTGATASGNFPTATGAFQPAFGGNNNDAFVAKIVDNASPCVPPLPPGGM